MISLWISKCKTEITIEASSAVPKSSMLNESPMILWVIINVIALMTNKNAPSVNIVTGNVKKIRNGFTKTFKNDKMMLATIAAPTPLK